MILCEPSLSICVGPRRSPAGAVSVLCVGSPRSLRRSLRRGPALSVSGPALSVLGPALSMSGPGALCVGAPSVVPPPLSRCPSCAPTLSSLSPGAISLGARRSPCQGSALFRDLCRAPPSLSGLRLLFRSSALFSALCVEARRSVCESRRSLSGSRRSLYWGPAVSRPTICVSGHGAPTLFVRCRRSVCPSPATPSSDPRATHPPPSHPSNPARSLLPGENPKPYCLGDYMIIYTEKLLWIKC